MSIPKYFDAPLAPLLALSLCNGRNDRHKEVQAFGFDGPDITGIESVYSMGGNMLTVWFDTPQAKQQAQDITGWPCGVDPAYSLNMLFDGNDVICQSKDHHGHPLISYYGDWEVHLHRY